MANEYNINIYDEEFTIELNEQGPQGATGPQGLQGPTGPQGPKGEPGRDGIDGEPGPANVLSIGTVTKGEEAIATITGDSPNQVLNLVLPKGDKGDKGEVGPKGDKGIQGRTGDIGPKGDRGDVGPEGKAATIRIGEVYESDHAWVTNSGSEQDVVLDFGLQRGPQGQIGPRGISVTGVEEISRQGLVSTYRMYFSDGTYFDYEVKDGSVSGITREDIIDKLGFEPASYTSVEEISDLIPNEATTNNKLTDKKYVDDNYNYLDEKIEELKIAKLPNATIIGSPKIEGSYVSGFSYANYLQFPFIDISRGLPFDIYFPFTTGANITVQQNILDSYFGIALAIQNGKGVMALSSNGSSWDIGVVNGTYNLQPNTTYYAKISWTGTQYTTSLSTDGQSYTSDMVVNSSLSPHKTTIYIGASPDLFGAGTSHPFLGTINFNGAKVVVNGTVAWEGYADAGLATRADLSLSNLNEQGEAKFERKLDHFPKYNIGNDSSIYSELEAMKRSTFDRSKTSNAIIGNCIITDDGILKVQNKNSGVYTKQLPTINANTSLKIKMKINSGNYTSKAESSILIAGNASDTWHHFIGIQPSAGKVACRLNADPAILNDLTIQENTDYDIELYYDSKTKRLTLTVNDNKKVAENYSFLESISKFCIGNLYTLADTGNYNSLCSIDLKHLVIEVDEKEVLNYNKTGIDQIKKDDYTVVGNPVISDDGIASGFSTSNYLYKTVDFTNANKFEIISPIIKADIVTSGETAGRYFMRFWNGTSAWINCYVLNGYAYCTITGSSSHSVIFKVLTDKFQVKFVWDGAKYYVYSNVNNSGWILRNTFDDTSKYTALTNSDKAYIGVSIYSGGIVNPFDFGPIDLNTFKIYVDDQLVYQPTLRIPYTQSKTGSKIVDVNYRDRVGDMYNQFGYTHYYTIGENNYTLQTVPNEKIIDSYYADNSFMELTADLSLTQGGGAMSGQTVNLKRPYKDNKYIVTIGTSSKDTNNFVASATGQWITKGKGVLG